MIKNKYMLMLVNIEIIQKIYLINIYNIVYK